MAAPPEPEYTPHNISPGNVNEHWACAYHRGSTGTRTQ